MNKNDLEAAFTEAGLSRLLKDIDQVSKASIRLYTTRVDESTLHLGASKLGGLPDLPAGTSWPAKADGHNPAPASGLAEEGLLKLGRERTGSWKQETMRGSVARASLMSA